VILIGWLTASLRETTMALVEHRALLGSRQLDMGNVGENDQAMTDDIDSRRARTSPARHYALVPDGIWDGTSDSRLTGTAVVVSGALIESVTPVEELQPYLRRVDLPGCTVVPGLMDAHAHYSAPMGPAFLAAGVTTIRDVGNDLQWILDQRAANSDRPDRGPAIVCCGHLQDGPEPYWPRMGRANADADAVRRSVREHIESGVDAIKLYPGLDAEMTAAGIDEAHRLGKPATAHLGSCTVEDAVAAGLDGIEHLAGCHVAWREATDE
jgi:hypothetical protein